MRFAHEKYRVDENQISYIPFECSMKLNMLLTKRFIRNKYEELFKNRYKKMG